MNLMIVALNSIVNEISALKIEWTPKQRTKINLFEEDPDPGLKINSFASVIQYRTHLDKFYISAKREIEVEISRILDTKISIIRLEEYRFFLNENMQHYLPENFNLILGSLKVNVPLFKSAPLDLVLKQKLEIFVAELKQLINRLVEFIRHKIKLYKKWIIPFEIVSNKLKLNHNDNSLNQGSLFPPIEKKYPTLFWDRTDSDLLELILALAESKAIITETGPINLNSAIRFCENLFNLKIKSPGIKINKLGDRMKNESKFLYKLNGFLELRKQRLDSRKD